MDYLKAIPLRKSRRSYTGPVPEADAAPLSALCEKLAGEYGVYLKLVPSGAAALFGGFGKTYGLFTGVDALVVLGLAENNPENLEKLGHAGEKLVLEATGRGLGTCWVGGTFDRAALQGTVPGGIQVVGVLTIGTVEEALRGKEKFMYGMVHRKTKSAGEMSEGLSEAPAWFARGVEAATRAPSAVNAQPVTFTWRQGEATARVPGARDMQYIDLGIAKLHFELAAGGSFATGNGGVFVPAEGKAAE